jgi:hypothetical protein
LLNIIHIVTAGQKWMEVVSMAEYIDRQVAIDALENTKGVAK